MPCLAELNLEKNKLRDGGTRVLAPALLHCTSLTTLVLRRNDIGHGGAAALGKMLGSGCVQPLEVRTSPGTRSQNLTRTCPAPCPLPPLSSRFPEFVRPTDPEFDYRVARAKEGVQGTPHTICNLDLAWNSITAEGSVALMDGLLRQTVVTTLDLSFNAVCRRAETAVATMLAFNSTITHLDLSHNGLDGAFLESLSSGLNRNTSIRGLHMKGAFACQACLWYTPPPPPPPPLAR